MKQHVKVYASCERMRVARSIELSSYRVIEIDGQGKAAGRWTRHYRPVLHPPAWLLSERVECRAESWVLGVAAPPVGLLYCTVLYHIPTADRLAALCLTEFNRVISSRFVSVRLSPSQFGYESASRQRVLLLAALLALLAVATTRGRRLLRRGLRLHFLLRLLLGRRRGRLLLLLLGLGLLASLLLRCRLLLLLRLLLGGSLLRTLVVLAAHGEDLDGIGSLNWEAGCGGVLVRLTANVAMTRPSRSSLESAG
jgi:hypothetical protein